MSPTLKRVPPYRIFIWSEENQASFEDLHVHVGRGRQGSPGYMEAEIWLGPPVAIKDPGNYPERELIRIQGIVERYRLKRKWNGRFPESRQGE